MFLIAVEVEYTLNEVLEKHGGVPLQQQVSKAKLPKAAKERRKETHLVLSLYGYTKNLANQKSTESETHPTNSLIGFKRVRNAACFVRPAQYFISKLRAA